MRKIGWEKYIIFFCIGLLLFKKMPNTKILIILNTARTQFGSSPFRPHSRLISSEEDPRSNAPINIIESISNKDTSVNKNVTKQQTSL